MKKGVAIGVTALFLGVGGASAANSPTNAVYGNAGEKVVKAKTVVKSTTATKPAATTGTLPFTGADLTIALVGGMALLGTGYSLRRASRRSKD